MNLIFVFSSFGDPPYEGCITITDKSSKTMGALLSSFILWKSPEDIENISVEFIVPIPFACSPSVWRISIRIILESFNFVPKIPSPKKISR